MRITQADMDSRRRMAVLRSKLSDAMVDDLEELTYAELLFVLGELVTRWASELRKEDLGEDDESATETSRNLAE